MLAELHIGVCATNIWKLRGEFLSNYYDVVWCLVIKINKICRMLSTHKAPSIKLVSQESYNILSVLKSDNVDADYQQATQIESIVSP